MLKSSEKSKNSKFCLISWLMLLAICVSLASCGETSTSVQPDSSESGEISVVIRLSKVAAASMSRAEVVITASDMAEIRQDLAISGDTVTGLVQDIPAGTNRLFALNGYDSSGSLIYSGSATTDVIAGQQVTVRITMRRVSSQAGSPQFRMLSPASAQIAYSSGVYTTTITGEIENTGTADATNVVIDFRARSSNNAPITDASVNIGTAKKGESKIYTASFANTAFFSSDSRYVSKADYTITYNEGGPDTGTITVQ